MDSHSASVACLGLVKCLQSWAPFSRNHRHPQCPAPPQPPPSPHPPSWLRGKPTLLSPALVLTLFVPSPCCSSCCSRAEPGTGEALAGTARSPWLAHVGWPRCVGLGFVDGGCCKVPHCGDSLQGCHSLSSLSLLPLPHLFKSPYAYVHDNRKCGAVFSLLLSYALG